MMTRVSIGIGFPKLSEKPTEPILRLPLSISNTLLQMQKVFWHIGDILYRMHQHRLVEAYRSICHQEQIRFAPFLQFSSGKYKFKIYLNKCSIRLIDRAYRLCILRKRSKLPRSIEAA